MTLGFCPKAGFPLYCRVISDKLFRDLLSPNGYISGYLNLLRLLIYKDFYAPPLIPDIIHLDSVSGKCGGVTIPL
jgi:hypothetical protein